MFRKDLKMLNKGKNTPLSKVVDKGVFSLTLIFICLGFSFELIEKILASKNNSEEIKELIFKREI
jgi:hypothetical protein